MTDSLPTVACGEVHAHAAAAPGRGSQAHAEFLRRKQQILASLDKSPKGSIDAPIVDFLSWLNSQADVVTTSSCSGRISIFHGAADPANAKGGEWLLISHETLGDARSSWAVLTDALQKRGGGGGNGGADGGGGVQRGGGVADGNDQGGTVTSLLLEPFVLHAECANAEIAQLILEAAREVGFRESGVSLGRRRVMVQLRTLAFRLEVPLALNGAVLITPTYFETLVGLANERLIENGKRIDRLWAKLRDAFSSATSHAKAAAKNGSAVWVLECPQSLARSVKLALEERGWMDESRKMASVENDGVEAGAARIGLPISSAAAEYLKTEACSVDGDEGLRARDIPSIQMGTSNVPCDSEQKYTGVSISDDVNPAEVRTGVPSCGSKKYRPATVAADLLLLWRQPNACGMSLFQGDILPAKARASQRETGVVGQKATQEREAIVQAVNTVVVEIAKTLGETCGDPFITAALLAEARAVAPCQWRQDIALLPRGAFSGDEWNRLHVAAQSAGGLWEAIRTAIGARMLARQQEILVDSGVREGAVEILAGNGDGWVVVPGPRGVKYTFDVTKCMFSEGNAAEKERVSKWDVTGETILDLYAGIGFWTLPLLAAGARRVLSCEWNPNAIEALRRGLALLPLPATRSAPKPCGQEIAVVASATERCEILPGDNRRPEVRAAAIAAGRCHRVILGLIPFSRDGFQSAVASLRLEGGVLHVHWNTPSDEEQATAQAVARELESVFLAELGKSWTCTVRHVQRVKWFAPRIRHVRIDIECRPSGAGGGIA